MKWFASLLARLWLAVSLGFALSEWSGADPVRQMMGPQATAAEVQRRRMEMGADSGWVHRYGEMLGGFARLERCTPARAEGALCIGPLRLSLGTSFVRHVPVSTALQERLGPTAALTLATLVVQSTLGLGLGLALRRRASRATADIAGAVAASVPAFVLAMALQAVLAAALGWFPIGGYGVGVWGKLHALALPAFSLGLLGATAYAKVASDLWSNVQHAPYVKTARAKGDSKRRTFWVHIVRTSCVPLAAMLATDAGVLLGGVATVETIFRYPGLGMLAAQSVLAADLPMLTGIVVLSTVCVSLCSALGRWAVNALGART